MSLSIPTDKVTSVYALGQWHPVRKGTFDIEAYEVKHSLDSDRGTFYQMGEMYPDVPLTPPVSTAPGSPVEHWSWRSPQGCTGCCWVCPKTNQVVALSILEIKAWRYAPE